ncbi:uncharacterized protein LOC106024807 isoform X1 [Esox lucius]|uniref:uncharacterized protein LOC106024807 isoform X1 n=1 Tax=Esox lucius TaxID=8010 RepID=UPI001476EAD4|nr:uncharacterized protein LOC106024807 isoform X1 [Esox lucius]XP_012994602.2 uncharacterized protein LOC106024807 isoform X1 [Esox lucius]XP_034144848.1 uncharacterized protein LOC106024807 isoform X1 [Esox lucius]
MEFLESTKTDLCQWLSTGAQYIIDKCEDILSVKQGKAVCNQDTDEKKINMLLKCIMERGEKTCEEFLEILKKEQKHYPSLQQHFSKNMDGPTVYADCNSIVDTRKVTNVQVKKDLNMNATVQAGEMNPSGVNHSQLPQCADMVATNSSFIFASEVSNCTIDGDFNMSLRQAPPPNAPQCPGPSESKESKLTSTCSIADIPGFLKRNRVILISRVKNVKAIVDTMQSTVYPDELAANVNAQSTTQEMMRLILDTVTSTGAMKALIKALHLHQKDVMDDLMRDSNNTH